LVEFLVDELVATFKLKINNNKMPSYFVKWKKKIIFAFCKEPIIFYINNNKFYHL